VYGTPLEVVGDAAPVCGVGNQGDLVLMHCWGPLGERA